MGDNTRFYIEVDTAVNWGNIYIKQAENKKVR